MSDRYVLEVTPQSCYEHLDEWGEHTTNYNVLWSDDAEKVKLVVFTGGNDVDPKLYGEKRHPITNHPNVARDKHEIKCFDRARSLGIPMVGICRGSQFLCVMAGGKLVQDVTNHGGYHKILTHGGKTIECNSTHHQMQRPPATARVLAAAEPKRSKHYLDGDGNDIGHLMPSDVEVAYYPNIHALGVQYHPEWLGSDHPCVQYYKEAVREFLFPKTS